MFAVEEFLKYCSQTLELNFGNVSNSIIDRIRTKKNLDENSTDIDIEKFIDLMEANISVFSGKHKANEICNIIRAKVSEFGLAPKSETKTIPKKETKVEELGYTTKITDVGKIIEIGKISDDVEKKEDIATALDKKVVDKEKDISTTLDKEEVEKKDDIITDIEEKEVEEMPITSGENIDDKNYDKNDLEYENSFEYENKLLILLESGYKIDNILDELKIEEEILADRIIDLDTKEFIILEDKNWELTQKGKDRLKESRELLKKLKLDYLHGNINKEEFLKKSKELEYLRQIKKKEKIPEIKEIEKRDLIKEDVIKEADKEKVDIKDDVIKEDDKEKVDIKDDVIKEDDKEKVDDIKDDVIKEEEEKIICHKCGIENRLGNRFCTKCGESLI